MAPVRNVTYAVPLNVPESGTAYITFLTGPHAVSPATLLTVPVCCTAYVTFLTGPMQCLLLHDFTI